MVSSRQKYKSTSCTIGNHPGCTFATECRCYCHNMERNRKELEHYKTLDCKWGKHQDCHDELGRCSCECHQ